MKQKLATGHFVQVARVLRVCRTGCQPVPKADFEKVNSSVRICVRISDIRSGRTDSPASSRAAFTKLNCLAGKKVNKRKALDLRELNKLKQSLPGSSKQFLGARRAPRVLQLRCRYPSTPTVARHYASNGRERIPSGFELSICFESPPDDCPVNPAPKAPLAPNRSLSLHEVILLASGLSEERNVTTQQRPIR